MPLSNISSQLQRHLRFIWWAADEAQRGASAPEQIGVGLANLYVDEKS